ncbi:fumarylacetoacetate hydrolase family protein [Mycobacterium sp. 21AC1]|uniref:fumarylacetoacetate hydrolase family protein n=1 Tax=[Mycobacterium] appelbergii TaxID=2939269 RepID=UPI002938ED28|nr:fumarylacetoacetate hydrolase family protein [Mycobacterium sp. 21AC1]MDV3127009.1 fumarylacetoacetate hydrolase family protein [Mycobacterium sp. 21AC1]
MRLMNLNGRLHVSTPSGAVDVAKASDGRFGPDPQAIYEGWDAFEGWYQTHRAKLAALPAVDLVPAELGSPVPAPRQVFAVGLNYSDHAAESGFSRPEEPVIFTKFTSSITGPVTTVPLPAGSVDWEVELVVVIGRGGRNIPVDDAWRHVAGLTVGQDLSERQQQHSGPAPQFSLAKSHRGFSPIGPAVVTVDEVGHPDDLEIRASINGEVVQEGRTSQLIFPVSVLLSKLSETVELYSGDVVFTGTPAGVGAGRTPPRFLGPGDVLRSYVEGIGELQQTFVASVEDVAVAGRGA